MDIKQFTDILFKKAEAAGFTEFEIYFVEDESASVTIYKTEIEKYENNKRKGLSFRGLYGGVMGYAYAERMDEDVADLLIESAKQNAEVIDAEETEFIYGGAELSAYGETNTYFKALEAVGLDEKIEKAKLMEQAVLNADPRIKSVSSAVISGGCSYVSLVNSKGVALSQRANYIMAYLSAFGE